MKGSDLLRGMSSIDEELLGEALEKAESAGSGASAETEDRKIISARAAAKRKKNRAQIIAMAASVAIVVLIGARAFRNGLFSGAPDHDASPAANSAGSSETVPGSAPSAASAVTSESEAGTGEITVNEPYFIGDGSGYAAGTESQIDAQGGTTTDAPVEEPLDPYYNQTVPQQNPGLAPFLPDEPVTDKDSGMQQAPNAYMVDRYDLQGNFSYAVPQNGQVGFSAPLRAAMKEHGADGAVYRVAVHVFKDGQQLEDTDPDIMEIFEALHENQGIITAIETFGAVPAADGSPDMSTAQRTLNTLHATYNQLQELKAPEGFGLMLWLYGELAD